METTTIYALYKDYTPFYVGKTKTKSLKGRFYKHKCTFGKDIIMKKLDIIPSVKVEDWKPYEIAWIEFYKVWNEATLVNKNEGGGGPSFHTDEVKDKIKKSKIGTKQPNISKAKKGIPNPKLSEALKGKPNPKLSEAKKGTKYSPETCAKISASTKGKPKSAEHCAKMSASRTGMKYNKKQQNAYPTT